jgi:hypothetical protein
MDKVSKTPRVDREEYTVTKSDIGFKVTNSALARILEEETNAAWIEEELADGDKICFALGVERTEGGRLPIQKILHAIRERQHGITKDCWCLPTQDTQEPTVWIHKK